MSEEKHTPLLPCPFCGGEAVDRREVDGFPIISCAGEECFGPQTNARTFQDALVQWNNRSGQPPTEEIERLETECNDWEARFWVERARAEAAEKERDESKAALARLGKLSIKADQAINIIVNEFSVMKDRAEAAESDYRTVCEGLVQCHRERAEAEARAEAAEKEVIELKRTLQWNLDHHDR